MTLDRSLFARLAVVMSVLLTAGAGILITASWYSARTAADDAYDRVLVGAALQIADGLAVQEGALIIDLRASAFEMLGLADRDRIFYRILDPSGKTLTGHRDLETDVDLGTVRREPVLSSGLYKGEAVRIAVVGRALSDPAASGWAHVILAQTVEARRALTHELTLGAAITIVIMCFLALVVMILSIRQALRPVNQLGGALRRRDPQDLTPLSVSVPRELRPFVGSINHFMGRLNERVVLLQRFIADAAHQIRTPLTALTAQLDLLNNDKLDEADRQHLGRVQQRADELARLTNQLLSHAMVIHRAESVQLEPVDLNEIARRAFRVAVPITVDPDIVVSFEEADVELVVLGDPVSLREAIVNVIDNALRHGTLSRLEVRVRDAGPLANVEVEDDGPGIPSEEWPHVTQRFQTSKAGEGSAGLGFAIASEVAAAHGGALQFRAKDEDAHGFTVILALPRIHREGK
ncbi:sensor histidine kinase [Rhizobium sp. CNPSo 4062]|uniref:sensor histidine kinase n=1 Tax=Rhizobium sp. CNPSo 4062 TaxID=3021410 RepID=UPI00254F18BB|nr:sensor histidine kinase [Rhizobium sp. CNPSo 4062]MDK4705943.1 sensor histidine kinase [Rhizobium sp. CNPSo 4062]